MRPLNVVSHAISKRLEYWLARKPKLYVTAHPQTAFWCPASRGEGMQLVFVADPHDDPDHTLLLTGAYIKGTGTKPWLNFTEPIEVSPQEMLPRMSLSLWKITGGGGWTRTNDLRIMRPSL